MANAGGGIQQFNSTGGAQEILNLYSDDNLYFSGPSNIIIRPGGGGEAARFDHDELWQRGLLGLQVVLKLLLAVPYLLQVSPQQFSQCQRPVRILFTRKM
jgi:hypothetical protein